LDTYHTQVKQKSHFFLDNFKVRQLTDQGTRGWGKR